MADIVIVSGSFELPARLADTATASIVVRALPLHLTAIFWGRLVRLETPLESYREPDAVILAKLGQILWAPECEAILIPYGPTPLSKSNEIRLMEPSNLWAEALEDVQGLRDVHDGAKVTIARYGTAHAERPKGQQARPKGPWRG
jgi:uncharacterized protein